MEIINEFGINPYKYLKVKENCSSKEAKKAYKILAKKYHPDKNEGTTEAQFKLLYICYKYVLKNCVDKEPSSYEQLKNSQKEEIVISEERTLYNTNMDDDDVRKQLFADDDINMKEFENHMKRIQGLSTSYSVENFYKKEILDSMKTNNKFDLEKFNAYFTKLKKDGKIENQLVKKEKIVPSNSNIKYVNVNMFDDRIINSIDKDDGNYKKILKQTKISNEDMLKVLNTDKDDIKKIIRENKKNTGKLSRSKLKELELKARNHSRQCDEIQNKETEDDLLKKQYQEIQQQRQKQKEYILNHKHIFVSSIDYRS